MPTSFLSNLKIDFSLAPYTAVISDLHLSEAEPINIHYPLWKKFKTRQFFFDNTFVKFLDHIQLKAGGAPIELVLNGDIFDFDSVMALPDQPVFHISWLERHRGLSAREDRAQFKIQKILDDHVEFISGLRDFIVLGHRVVFIIGNHDLELHFPKVQEKIFEYLALPKEVSEQVRFVEWFYISNQDTLIEHGNQYDPYCLCEDPINPYVRGYNYLSLKLPFGNLACRYIMNGMGFFNPHVDTNYIMNLSEYINFFFRYIWRAQPGLILTWFWGAVATLIHSFLDRLTSPIRNPLKIEDRIAIIAQKSNAETRMVREMKELFAAPAASNPILLARELWLDRAILVFLSFFLIFQLFVFIRTVYAISVFWTFIPLFLLLPFFLFYSRSINSHVSSFKEPDERILAMASAITKVNRIIYGHTHHSRHEMIGAVEHLNSGCWSPAFLDVECTKPLDQKTFIWISSLENGTRRAQLMKFLEGKSEQARPSVR